VYRSRGMSRIRSSASPLLPQESWREFVRFSGTPAPGCGDRVDKPGTTGALWVFSPYACGVYGFGSNLAIAHDGAKDPMGQIVLTSRKRVSLQAGSGFLLRAQATLQMER
jgi:hypothetical protein